MAYDSNFEQEQEMMVRQQLASRDIRDPRVLEAMLSVPRHLFVPPEHRAMAYDDGPLPIGNDQTISQPYVVALMTQLLELNGSERVLEVGTGSGYQAAVLAELAREVHSVERWANLARLAQRMLLDLGYDNVFVHEGDGSLGWSQAAPYAGIIVTAAAPRVPPPLLDQLAEGGRLVIPVGHKGGQNLERWRRYGEAVEREVLAPVAFVPLLGKHGWRE